MQRREFTIRQSRFQTAAALIYIPFHLVIIPTLVSMLLPESVVDLSMLNFICYAIGALFMVITQWGFLRREYYTLYDNLIDTLLVILSSYFIMLALNYCMSALITLISSAPVDNLNNDGVMEIVSTAADNRPMIAAMVFLAPILEECMFRAGVFGFFRRYNRKLAYIITIAVFALYHVWSYAIHDPSYWIYCIQYIPVGYLFCRCYEKTNTIWGPIFFHMFINDVSLRVLSAAQALM